MPDESSGKNHRREAGITSWNRHDAARIRNPAATGSTAPVAPQNAKYPSAAPA